MHADVFFFFKKPSEISEHLMKFY